MNVLITSDASSRNEYISNLIRGLENNNISVDCDPKYFWEPISKEYDILYFQWPEELISWEVPTEQKIRDLKNRIVLWKESGVSIFIMRHNLFPHRNLTLDPVLYQTVYENVDGVIHMGNFSIHDFKERYPHISPQHSVIPHPKYYPDKILSRSVARKILHISPREIIFLVFGEIRAAKEQFMITEPFERLSLELKRMIITRGTQKTFKPKALDYPLRRIIWEIQFALYRKKKKQQGIYINNHFVDKEELHNLIAAANVIIIPRIKSLNSGILPKAFSHKRVVIGSNYGNIGEILAQTGNPSFNPSSPNSIRDAMEKAVKLDKDGKGEKNKEYAEKHWASEKIGELHLNFFQQFKANL